jgi:hypothetical protein
MRLASLVAGEQRFERRLIEHRDTERARRACVARATGTPRSAVYQRVPEINR